VVEILKQATSLNGMPEFFLVVNYGGLGDSGSCTNSGKSSNNCQLLQEMLNSSVVGKPTPRLATKFSFLTLKLSTTYFVTFVKGDTLLGF